MWLGVVLGRYNTSYKNIIRKCDQKAGKHERKIIVTSQRQPLLKTWVTNQQFLIFSSTWLCEDTGWIWIWKLGVRVSPVPGPIR